MAEGDWSDHVPRFTSGTRGLRMGVAAVLGLIFLGIGGALLAVAPRTEIACVRPAGSPPNCRITSRVFFDWVPIRALQIDALEGATVKGESGTDLNFHLLLAAKSGPVRVNLLGEHSDIERARSEIESYLENSTRRELQLTLDPKGPLLSVARIGVGIALLGILALISLLIQAFVSFVRFTR